MPVEQGLSPPSSIDHSSPERLACDEIDRLMSLPVETENTISSGVVVVQQEEKKDELDGELAKDLLSLLDDLEYDEEVSDAEIQSFVSFVERTLPMMAASNNSMTAKTTSDIMSFAVQVGVSIPIVERLLYEVEQLVMHASRDRRQLYRRNPICLVSDLITRLSAMRNTSDVTDHTIENEDDDILDVETFNESYGISNDAIEVQVDVINVEEEEPQEGEPWWEVASKLHGYSIRPPVPEMTPQQLLQKIDKSPMHRRTLESSVEDDINGFWSQQQKNSTNHKSVRRRVQPRRTQNDSRAQRATSKSRNAKPSGTKEISAVASVSTLIERQNQRRKSSHRSLARPWQGPYSKRTANHVGFSNIDKHSLYKATQVQTNLHCLDPEVWEARVVKQRFLYEHSLTVRNWFGTLKVKAGNTICPQPVCRPSSMEMPMDAESWTEDWIKPPRSALLEALGPEYEVYMGDDDDSDGSWEETPECGKLKNVVVRPGTELISRLSPDYTSSLRRSRWRKKYVRREVHY